MVEAPLRKGWLRVTFAEMAENITERVEPTSTDGETYVGLEHLDPGSLTVRRWGAEVALIGTKLRMRKGDILFGKRNAYLRRVALAPHDGVFSAHGMVLRARPRVVLPAFLPFFMLSDLFMDRAVRISVGSLSPTINWGTLKEQEFLLPPMAEQQRIANLLIANLTLTEHLRDAVVTASALYGAAGAGQFARPGEARVNPEDWKADGWACEPLENLIIASAPICYGIVQVGDFDPLGVPTLAIKDLQGDFSNGVHRTSSSIEARYARSRIESGDLLVSIKATIGEARVVPSGFEGNISRDLARIRFDTRRLRPQFFLHLYRSPRYTQYVKSLLVGSTRAELSIAALRKMLVPFPQVGEQDQLADEMDAILRSKTALAGKAAQASGLTRVVLNEALAQAGGRG
jgi:type I restriction enzyme, S subunit